jgi:hypothetical protein
MTKLRLAAEQRRESNDLIRKNTKLLLILWPYVEKNSSPSWDLKKAGLNENQSNPVASVICLVTH